jgi:hypothetical protein
MSEEHSTGGAGDAGGGSTVENRVYLFRELAAAFLDEHGSGLTSPDEADRARARAGLAEVAYAACLIADRDDLEAEELAALVAAGWEASDEEDEDDDDD